jgi:hypothetical protein
MKNAKKNLADAKNPLTILFKILANALLEDESGIDGTAFNALLRSLTASDILCAMRSFLHLL